MTGDPVSSSATPDADTERRQAAREYALALVLLAGGAGLILLGYGRTWVEAVVVQTGLPNLVVDLTGQDLLPVGAALPVVVLAGIAAVVATRRAGRVIAGIVLALVGLVAMGHTAFFVHDAMRDRVDSPTIHALVADRVGVLSAGQGDPAVDMTLSTTGWWVLVALGGVAVLAGGVLVALRGRRWAALGRRYERSATDPITGETPQHHDLSAWDQLDRGLDPTDGPMLRERRDS